MNNPNNLVVPALLICLLLIMRIRRVIRFQKYNAGSLVGRMVLFSVFAVLSFIWAVAFPLTLLTDVIGIALGLCLLYFGVNHAIFEKRNDDLYYRTHMWVEILVLVLFVLRYVYRFYMLSNMHTGDNAFQQQDGGQNMQTLAADPLTGLTLFVIYTYYIGYFFFIYQKGKKVLAVQTVEPTKIDRGV